MAGRQCRIAYWSYDAKIPLTELPHTNTLHSDLTALIRSRQRFILNPATDGDGKRLSKHTGGATRAVLRDIFSTGQLSIGPCSLIQEFAGKPWSIKVCTCRFCAEPNAFSLTCHALYNHFSHFAGDNAT